MLKTALSSYQKNIFNFDPFEFDKDVRLFLTVRKMVKRFFKTGSINEKLILNNIIICLNNFGISTTNTIFRTICDDSEFGVIKSFLIFLNSCSHKDDIPTNNIIDDILSDVTHRYHLQPKSEN